MKIFLKPPAEFRNGHKDRKRLASLATMPCVVCSEYEPAKNPGRLEIHHFIGSGIGKKASDLLTLPLCHFYHQGNKDAADPKLKALSIHGLTKEFEKKFGTQLDLLKLVNSKLGCEEQYREFYRITELNQ